MDYSRYHSLSCERQDKVLIVSLNRPEALNAINADLHTELAHIFADIALDQETNVVVLTGKGRAFSAGGDIKWFQELTPPQLDALFIEARKIIVDLLEVQQPIIGVVSLKTRAQVHGAIRGCRAHFCYAGRGAAGCSHL